MNNIYDYPEYYDVLFGWDRSAETYFLDGLFQLYGFEHGSKILEVACGTGIIGIKLAFMDWKVTGLDISLGMLHFLKKKSKENKVRIKTAKRDMINFNLMEKQDIAFCPSGSFGLLHNKKDAISHLKSVAKNLKKKGIYVLDMSFKKGKTMPFNYNKAIWSIEKSKIKISLKNGKVWVCDLENNFDELLEWGSIPLEYNPKDFIEIVNQSKSFTIDKCYPESELTEEGISIFDLNNASDFPVTGRGVVVLKKT